METSQELKYQLVNAKGFTIKAAWFAFLCLAASIRGELKQGRYIGWIELENKGKIATVADFFLESPDDLTQFPRLTAMFKMSLGGYNTHEYFTEKFKDLKYDFDNAVLTLDEPQNDLQVHAKVVTAGSDTRIIGEIQIRSSVVSGSLELQLETDEPEDISDEDFPAETPSSKHGDSFIPLVEGQYTGSCKEESQERPAVIQLQTLREGSKTNSDNIQGGIAKDYSIVGRLGLSDLLGCGDLKRNQWCTFLSFENGTYNPFRGSLSLSGPQVSETCKLKNGSLECTFQTARFKLECNLAMKDFTIKPARYFTRTYHLLPTANQKSDLPEVSPPKNEALFNALRGDFWGYLHNEITNSYQLVRLGVHPFNSTDNPHNPNQLMVTTDVSIFLGQSTTSPFVTQKYDSRAFYIRPGYALSGTQADSFIIISEWKIGYIRADWYSHAFGRVGTVQFVKNSVLASLPAELKVVAPFIGIFEGPVGVNGIPSFGRWFKFLSPTQPNSIKDNLINVSGSYQAPVDLSPVRSIDSGSYDLYDGRLGWRVIRGERSTLASGYMDSASNLKLYFPPAPGVVGTLMGDFGFETYRRGQK